MTISYSGSQGSAYLSRIDYTGNVGASLATTNSVIFYLEDQPNLKTSYRTLFPITLDKRLKTIKILAKGNLVRAYKLEYVRNNLTETSLLHYVTQYGNDAVIDSTSGEITGGTSLPKITLAWQGDNYSFDRRIAAPISRRDINNADDYLTADFNGDGLEDFFFWGARSGRNSLHINTGKGESYSKYRDPLSIRSLRGRGLSVTTGDFNGDGKADLYFWEKRRGNNKLFLSNGNGTFTQYDNPVSRAVIDKGNIDWILGDFNGDQKTDIYFWRTTDGMNTIRYSNGDGTFNIYNSPIPHSTLKDRNKEWGLMAGDFDGDGRSDVLLRHKSDGTAILYFSDGNAGLTLKINNISASTFRGDLMRWNLGDFNGDGLTDIFLWKKDSGDNYIYYSKGNGNFEEKHNQIDLSMKNRHGLRRTI